MNSAMDHDELREETALYVLDALAPSARDAFEQHLATCAECAAEVRSLRPVSAALAQAVPQTSPPPELRDRVLTSVGAADRRRAGARATAAPTAPYGLPWLAAAASALLAVGLGIYTQQLRGRISTLESQLRVATERARLTEQQIADARRTATQAQSTVAVLAAPDLARVDLAGQKAAPQASARAFWSRSRGLVFTASNLPPLRPGRVYQLWVVTAQAPISAGLLRPDADGRVTAVVNTPADLPQPVAMAVTDEPEGGVPAPTGDRYLVGSVNGA